MSDYAAPKSKPASVEEIADAKAQGFDTPVSQTARVVKKQRVRNRGWDAGAKKLDEEPYAPIAGSPLPTRFGLLPPKEVSTQHAVRRINFFQLEYERALAESGDSAFGGTNSGADTAAAESTKAMMNNYASDISHIQLTNAHYNLLSPQADAATRAAIKAVSIGQQLHYTKPIGETLDAKHSKAIGDALVAQGSDEAAVTVGDVANDVVIATREQVLACYKSLSELSEKVVASLLKKQHEVQESPKKKAIEEQISRFTSAGNNMAVAVGLVGSGLSRVDAIAAGPQTASEFLDAAMGTSGTDIAGKASGAASTAGRIAGVIAELYYAKDIQRLEAQSAALGAAIKAYHLADLTRHAGEIQKQIEIADLKCKAAHQHYGSASNSRRKIFKKAGAAADKKMGDHQASQALMWMESTLQANALVDIACATGVGATQQLRTSVSEISTHRRTKWNTVEDTWGIALGGMQQQTEEATNNVPDLQELSIMARIAELWTNAAHEAKRTMERAILPTATNDDDAPQKGIKHVIGGAMGRTPDGKMNF